MKLLALFTLSTLTIGPVLGAFRDIQTVCDQTPDIGLFGKWLRANPDLYAFYSALRNSTIYVPSDEALTAYLARNNVTLARRATAAETSDSQYMTENGVNAINNARRVGVSTSGSVFVQSSDTGGDNSKHRRQFQNTTQNTGVGLSTGLGQRSNILFGDLQCTQGLIQVVDSYFTHPESVSKTLNFLSLTKFQNSLNSAGLGSKYDTINQTTIFAPVDSSFTNQSTLDAASVGNHIIDDTAFYSPDIKDGDVHQTAQGNNLYFTVKGSDFYVNCVHLVETDSIVSNGVVHKAAGIIPVLNSPPPCFTGPVQFTGAGSVSKAVNMMAIIGTVGAVVGLVL